MTEPSKPTRRRALGWMGGAAVLLRRARPGQARSENAGVGDAGVAPARPAGDPRAIVGARPGPLDVVFEGGGIKGAAFAGAVEILLGRGFKLRRLLGSSAGAITAAL